MRRTTGVHTASTRCMVTDASRQGRVRVGEWGTSQNLQDYVAKDINDVTNLQDRTASNLFPVSVITEW